MIGQRTTDVLREAAGISIGLAIVMIVLGSFAVLLPLATGIGVSILAGFAYLAHAFAAHGAGRFLWRALIGIFYVIGGGYLAFHRDSHWSLSRWFWRQSSLPRVSWRLRCFSSFAPCRVPDGLCSTA